MYLGAFEWRIEFPEVLDEEGNFIGFDCIIGNPPYIQLQSMGDDADILEQMEYETYARTGDIYCLFYEQGMNVLKEAGCLCYITSNKWMRASYGENLRNYFATKTNPILLVDFAGVKIFDSATVETNILLINKEVNRHSTLACTFPNANGLNKMSVFVQQCGSLCEFSSSDSWVILSPIEQSIKRKIEAVGTPLKDWDINIYRGVLTGYNEAFIISTEKRDEILANCHTDEERSRTAELIRPILRGRDIKRYGYEWAKLWLINTHNGVKGKFERIHIEDFPAVKAHLDQYWDKISKRADKGDTPYNLRNCAYMEDFLQPKIVWKRVGSILRFSYNENGAMALDSTCFATGKDIKFLVGILNSKMGHYLLKDAPKTGTGDLLISVQAVEPLKIPILNKGIKEELEVLLNKQLYSVSKERDKEINRIVFKLYGLLDEEIIFIENSL